MLTKNELKTLWKKHGFRPLKRLGQNFLVDKNIKDKILRHLQIRSRDLVLEIGSGFGELTVDLAEHAKRVIAVEKDKKIIEILKSENLLPNNVTIVECDFLDFNIYDITQNDKIIIYGNLPYYITSPILERLLIHRGNIKTIYYVLQKEVADRIVAKPHTKDIGRLSLFVQYHAQPRVLFSINKEAFYPQPMVASVLLELKMRDKKDIKAKDEKTLFEVIKFAYSQRRKAISNSISAMGIKKDKIFKLLKAAEVDPRSRAENLSLEDFIRLSDIFYTELRRPR